MIDLQRLQQTMHTIEGALNDLLPQIKENQTELRSKMAAEMPEFVREYDALMKGVWKGEKTAEDIRKFQAKYEHALKSKKNDLNNK